MIRRSRTILLGLLCAVCLQAPLHVSAIDLPFVPVEEPPVGSSAVVSETAAVIEEPADRETPIMTEAPAASKAAETSRNSRIPLTIAAKCCAVVIAGAVLFAIAKNRGKQ